MLVLETFVNSPGAFSSNESVVTMVWSARYMLPYTLERLRGGAGGGVEGGEWEKGSEERRVRGMQLGG